MPTFHHGKDSQVLVDEHDLSAFFNSFTVPRSADVVETSGFQTDDKTYLPGMRDGTVSLDGMWSPDVPSGDTDDVDPTILDNVFDDALGSGLVVFTIAAGGVTEGQPAIVGQTRQTQWDVSQSTSDIVSTSAGLQGTESMGRGVVLEDALDTPLTADTDSASVDNTSSTENGGLAVAHIVATDGTVTVKVQDSNDNAVWADLVTVASGVSTADGYSAVATGTVERYVRSQVTLGTATSVTVAVAFRRNP